MSKDVKAYKVNICGFCKKRKRLYGDYEWKRKKVCNKCKKIIASAQEVHEYLSYYSFGG